MEHEIQLFTVGYVTHFLLQSATNTDAPEGMQTSLTRSFLSAGNTDRKGKLWSTFDLHNKIPCLAKISGECFDGRKVATLNYMVEVSCSGSFPFGQHSLLSAMAIR